MNKLIASVGILMLLSSCGGGNMDQKKSKLDKLKKQQAELTEQIRHLEDEIAATDTTKSEKYKNVAVTEMQQHAFTHFLEVQANVEGDEDVMLNPMSSGTVTAINVKAGDHVRKGQILATLDDKIMLQTVGELQSAVDLATTVYQRQKNLWDQQIGSEIQYLQAKTTKESAEKRLANYREQWELTRIKAPFDGTVDMVNIKAGQVVSPQVPAIRIVNLNLLKIKGEIPEAYINRVHKNDEALVVFPDLNKEIKTRVSYSGSAINNMNRTFNVEVRLNNKENILRPNMLAVLKIADYTNDKSLSLPVNVIQKGLDGEYVFVAENKDGKMIAMRKQVKTGLTYNGTIEITEGLNDGDKVITTGYQNLIEGDVIKL